MKNQITQDLLSFIYNSPSAFHSIFNIKNELLKAGFIALDEFKPFILKSNQNYFVTRNDTSIIAFKIGELNDFYSFNIVSSHSDCPSFKVKPKADLNSQPYHKLNVEGYGGMLCSTWFDRPLSLAGRVITQNNQNIQTKLIDFKKNILSIPSIPIHFNRNANDGLTFNLSVDMFPTLGEDSLTLKEIIANELDLNLSDILQYDLYLYPNEKGYFWGINDEYISSFKLDDLQCAYTTLCGFINSKNKHNISVYCCFDNEEVGSLTRQGADSSFLNDVLNRISNALNKSNEEHYCALAKSFMVSADNAHAVHPNHPELTDPLNAVYMNKGIVIKSNASQSYTSDALSSTIFARICENAKVPFQYFTNKSGTRGGSTLGNISASHVSIMSVDIGIAQLAMHSIFETSGTLDNEYMVKAITEFYNSYFDFQEDGFIKICK